MHDDKSIDDKVFLAARFPRISDNITPSLLLF